MAAPVAVVVDSVVAVTDTIVIRMDPAALRDVDHAAVHARHVDPVICSIVADVHRIVGAVFVRKRGGGRGGPPTQKCAGKVNSRA